MLNNLEDAQDLVRLAHSSRTPVVVFNGDDECLVAMSPVMFERILFDGDLLNCDNRTTLHL